MFKKYAWNKQFKCGKDLDETDCDEADIMMLIGSVYDERLEEAQLRNKPKG